MQISPRSVQTSPDKPEGHLTDSQNLSIRSDCNRLQSPTSDRKQATRIVKGQRLPRTIYGYRRVAVEVEFADAGYTISTRSDETEARGCHEWMQPASPQCTKT